MFPSHFVISSARNRKYVEKQEVPLHDVSLVNSSDFAPPLFGGVIEGKLGNAARFLSGDDLQTLNHT